MKTADAASPPPSSAPESAAPPQRPFFYLASLLVIPVIFFLLLEMGLRLFGYGYPSAFFLPRRIQDQPVFVDNQRYTYRVFPPAMARSVSVMRMPAVKPPDTYRIFVFGESAAEGDPAPAFGFSRILEVMLRQRYPNRKFEVVNTAITAINSNVFYQIARECAAHQPDLFLIYAGNNEVIGPYGPGTVFVPFLHNLSLIRGSLAFRGTKTGQLLENLTHQFGAKAGPPKGWGGMGMFTGAQVSADDPRMADVYSHFRANLADLAAMARRTGAQTLLCTVPVNLKDGGPFASLHKKGLPEAQRKQWESLYNAGNRLQSSGAYDRARESFDRALKVDDRYADLWYRRAQCDWSLGRYDAAKAGFQRALDLDALRFRTDSRLNQTVRDLAAQGAGNGIRLADTEKALAQASPHGIPGSEVLYEHVHLNFHGNYLFARTVMDALEPMLSKADAQAYAPANALPSEQDCATALALTDWNRRKIAKDVLDRETRPPFTGQSDHEARVGAARAMAARYQAAGTEEGRDQAADLYRAAIARNGEDWVLRSQFGIMALAYGDNDEAERQFEAVQELVPQNLDARTNLAQAMASQRKTDEAIALYRQVIQEQPDYALAHGGLASALLSERQTEAAMQEFERMKQLNPSNPTPYMNEGAELSREGKTDEALRQYQEALKLDSGVSELHQRLAKLYASRKQWDPALSELQTAARLDPDDAETFSDLGKIYVLRKNDPAAISNFMTSLRLDPRQPKVEKLLADAYYRSGDTKASLAHIRQALALDPQSPEMENNLAVFLIRSGQTKEALTHFQAALRLDPNRAEYRRNLEMAQSMLSHPAPPS